MGSRQSFADRSSNPTVVAVGAVVVLGETRPTTLIRVLLGAKATEARVSAKRNLASRLKTQRITTDR